MHVQRMFLVILFTLSQMLLAHCDNFNFDEYGVEYHIEDTSLETALINDTELTSITYRDQSLVPDPNNTNDYNQITNNVFFFGDDKSYYIKSEAETGCSFLYYRDFDYVYQRVIKIDLTLEFESAAGITQAMIDKNEYDLSNYEIKGDFYKITSSLDEQKYITIRVNSNNYIDSLQFYDLDIDEQFSISGYDFTLHNQTEIKLPSYAGNIGVARAIRNAENMGFEITVNDDTLSFSNSLYDGEFDLITYELTVTRESDKTIYTMVWNTSLTFTKNDEVQTYASGLLPILAAELQDNNIEFILKIINQQEIENIENDIVCE